jgi:Aldo/keto reductase family
MNPDDLSLVEWLREYLREYFPGQALTVRASGMSRCRSAFAWCMRSSGSMSATTFRVPRFVRLPPLAAVGGWFGGSSGPNLDEFLAVKTPCARLGMDYVDLYQIHRWDEGTPVEETLEALDSLVRAAAPPS